jgi:hypothetical protein
MLMVGTFIFSLEVLGLKSMLNNKKLKKNLCKTCKTRKTTQHGYTHYIGCNKGIKIQG